MSDDEIRKWAWNQIFKKQWFWKLFGGGLLLGICGRAVMTILGGTFSRLGIIDWLEYGRMVVENQQSAMTTVPEITPIFAAMATMVTLFELFINWIMAAISAYGAAVILSRCLKDDSEGWLGAAFDGFKMPLELFMLFFRYALIYVGWAILSVPTFGLLMLIPFYRYRFLWLVKADRPDLDAGSCLAATRALMKGNMRRSFKLDCSFWKSITLVLVLVGLMMASMTLAPVLNSLDAAKRGILVAIAVLTALFSFLALIPAIIVLSQYISVAQGVLYRELVENKKQKERKDK